MDTFKLKVIAITAMLIDHIGAILVSNTGNEVLYLTCRGIGRIAFPIFAFLIVEGFLHTKDVKKYLLRLLAFAGLSEIPFDLAFYYTRFHAQPIEEMRYTFSDPSYLGVLMDRLLSAQNVFFTLFLGLLLMTLIHEVDLRFPQQTVRNFILANSLDVLLTAIVCAAALILRTDYDIAGIMIIMAFYLFRDSIPMMTIALFFIEAALLSQFGRFQQTGDLTNIISILATFSMIFIGFYNGTKGRNARYLFYVFYPAHLLVLYGVSMIL